ncbi:MAG: flavodoxin domain-containing protein [Candidatus Thalassarchaeaceae archaeon]|nr:flavodoxin domain-containing protein [Candidatus Thalassarchaeaceae archaeon]
MSEVVVWIADGCITCDACEEEYPEVFKVTDDTCYITADSRTDGGFDTNEGTKSSLKSGLDLEAIQDAAGGCPVDVIMVEVGGGGDSTPEAAAEDSADEVVEPVETAPVAVEASMDGDRSLLVLSGSQSGNSEAIAAKIGKLAGNYSLEATVKGMDEIQIGDLAGYQRILVICSTWGEGEMPDNAEDLWNAANADGAPSLSGSHFSVCSLGDTSYEFFCQSGIDWDGWFEKVGANRITPRVDCDVDYDAMADAWLADALAHMGAVDGDGNFNEEMVAALKEKAAGGSKGATAGSAFDIPELVGEEIQVNARVFRYDPKSGQSGHDIWRCAVPGSVSVLELLRLLKATEDGSLTFRDGNADDPTTAISANGRNILPGRVAISEIVRVKDGESSLRIDPLSGFDVIRDLAVDHSDYQIHLANSKPWMHATTREGTKVSQGIIGTMDAVTAETLHSASDFPSGQLLHASSDTVPHNRSYIGPAVIARLWARYNDPRTSQKGKDGYLATIESENGIKAEADLSSIYKSGRAWDGAGASLLEAKRKTLQDSGFTGRHGKHVWWFSETVKLSGRLNETVLAGATLGPFGMAKNAISGVLPRMLLGFTRTGGPMIRDLQALAAPPASVGKMPKMINSSVDDHHEVVAIFNKFDRRF